MCQYADTTVAVTLERYQTKLDKLTKQEGILWHKGILRDPFLPGVGSPILHGRGYHSLTHGTTKSMRYRKVSSIIHESNFTYALSAASKKFI